MGRQNDGRKDRKMIIRTPTFFAFVQQNNSRLRTERRHLSSLLPPPTPAPCVAASLPLPVPAPAPSVTVTPTLAPTPTPTPATAAAAADADDDDVATAVGVAFGMGGGCVEKEEEEEEEEEEVAGTLFNPSLLFTSLPCPSPSLSRTIPSGTETSSVLRISFSVAFSISISSFSLF